MRKANGWSQADLASKIGGDAGQISRYEHGRITPSADLIIRLAEVSDGEPVELHLVMDNCAAHKH